MIVVHEILAKDVHVLLTENYEIIEAFLFDRLDKSLQKRDRIG